MDQPLVSIQCLVYNHESYLRQCLDGFVMQKTNFRFEAIVHDDMSTDGSSEIIREYASKYPDIIKPIYEIENQYSKHDGSLNRIMFEACCGKYIAICEGDDYWTDSLKLQKQVDFLEKDETYGLCYTKASVIKGEKQKTNRTIGSDYICFNNLFLKNTIPTLTVLMRKTYIIVVSSILIFTIKSGKWVITQFGCGWQCLLR